MKTATLLVFVVAVLAAVGAVAQVVVAPVAPQSSSFDYAGLERVPRRRVLKNLQPAKVIGVETHQGIPVVQNASALQRPVILNADGSVWGEKKVLIVQNGRPAQVVAYPDATTANVTAPVKFVSPLTNTVHSAINVSVPAPVIVATPPVPPKPVAVVSVPTPLPTVHAVPVPPKVEIPSGPVTTPLGTVIAPDVRTHSPPAVDPTLFIPQPNVTHLGHVFHPATGAVSSVVHQQPVQLAPETEHRILQEVNRLVELIMHADATKQKKQAKALRGNLRRVLRRLVAHNIMPRTVETASRMAKVSLADKPKKAKRGVDRKADKASRAVDRANKAVQDASTKLGNRAPRRLLKRALRKADRAAKKAEREVRKAERAISHKLDRRINRIKKKLNKKLNKKAIKSARIAMNDAKALAKEDVRRATDAAAAAKAATPVTKPAAPSPTPAPVPSVPASAPVSVSGNPSIAAAIQQLREETRRSLTQLRDELNKKIGSSASDALVNIGKKVAVLSKSALAFEAHFKSIDNKLKSDAAAILGLNTRVDALAKTSARVEKALATINKDIAAVTSKFNSLSKREKTLTSAAKVAIKSLAAKVEAESKLVKKLVNTKSNFKRGVIASLAELDTNIAHLNNMAEL